MINNPDTDSVDLDSMRSASAYLNALLNNSAHQAWLSAGQLLRRYALTELYEQLGQWVQGCPDLKQLGLVYRDFKQKHFLRIAGRDFLGRAGFQETVQQISDLAAVCIQAGLEFLASHPGMWLKTRQANFRDTGQWHYSLVVLGLGKLGGRELNYVSDIDLLFLQDPAGQAREHAEGGFVQNKLCQTLSSLLGDQVQGDRVFKVDLRLRPQGQEGELVPSLHSALDYYQLSGRAWERQMLLKARPVAGQRALGTKFLQQIRPFVFRRFLDFQALDELRLMRDRILQETRDKQSRAKNDLKLGWGGIREVEFLVQCLQLVYGGRQPELDETNTLRCLQKLSALQILPQEAAQELADDYMFLRRVEHWIQLEQNRQLHRLPESDQSRHRLCQALGYTDGYQDLQKDLQSCRSRIHKHFTALFQKQDLENHDGRPGLKKNGPKDGLEEIKTRLSMLQPRIRQHLLDRVQATLPVQNPELGPQVRGRINGFLQQIGNRPGLVSLLNQDPVWLGDLFCALGQSSFISGLFKAQPGLVEGLSGLYTQDAQPDSEFWRRCSRVVQRSGAFEESLEWIRRFKNEHILYLALQDLKGKVTGQELETGLSSIADFVLEQTYCKVLEQMGLDKDLPLSVLALGRLGSCEMGYLSDLDLAFVYDPPLQADQRLIPEEVVRFIQRLMRMLSTPLQDGPGYAVDAQLRPTGNYGPLVSTKASWRQYYARQADIWEIQALLRLRAVAGQVELGQELQAYAAGLCYQIRSKQQVWPRLCGLRQRMLQERAQEKGDTVHLKLGWGGLADLEFMVQGAQLLHGAENPELQARNIRSLLPVALQELKLAPLQALGQAFALYRSLEGRLQHLTNSHNARLHARYLLQMQDLGIWPGQALSLENWQDLLQIRRRVRGSWQKLCQEFL